MLKVQSRLKGSGSEEHSTVLTVGLNRLRTRFGRNVSRDVPVPDTVGGELLLHALKRGKFLREDDEVRVPLRLEVSDGSQGGSAEVLGRDGGARGQPVTLQACGLLLGSIRGRLLLRCEFYM